MESQDPCWYCMGEMVIERTKPFPWVGIMATFEREYEVKKNTASLLFLQKEQHSVLLCNQ